MQIKKNKYKDDKKEFAIVIGNEYFFVEFHHNLHIFSYTTTWNSKIDRSFLKAVKQLEKEVAKI